MGNRDRNSSGARRLGEDDEIEHRRPQQGRCAKCDGRGNRVVLDVDQELNPYAAPRSSLREPAPEAWTPAHIRSVHIRHESSLKSAGALNLFGGAVGLYALGVLFSEYGLTMPSQTIGICFGLAAIAALNLYAGYRLRRLEPAARLLATLAWLPALVVFPLGTLFVGYVLYLLHSPKGRRVLSDDYAQIRAATPEIGFRYSTLVTAVVAVVLALAVASLFLVLRS
ncbi:MAG: hypothetical protein AAFQ82_04390 [Myxococcota bacterium]